MGSFRLHGDIERRIELSRLVLSQLPTTVVMPGLRLTEKLLRECADYSNEIVRGVGIRSTEDLYIRTRVMGDGARNGGKSSRRSLIIETGDNGWKFNEFSDETREVQEYESIGDWQDSLTGKEMLLVHSEDVELQRRCVHGTVGLRGKLGFGTDLEVFLSTGRIHARGLAERMDGKPWIRMRGSGVYNARRHKEEEDLGMETTSNEEDAENLLEKWGRSRRGVERLYRQVCSRYGEGAVMEFRIYPSIVTCSDRKRNEWSHGSVQVLDVDIEF